MHHFDHNYIDHVMTRLSGIEPAAKPLWGRMDRATMVRHLADIVRYSMGHGDAPLPDKSTWLTRNIMAPLLMHGLVRIPKNIKANDLPCCELDEILEPNPDKYLRRMLQEYLDAVQADEVTPPPHPAFGNVGIDGWAKLHVAHFDHHLRQFGA